MSKDPLWDEGPDLTPEQQKANAVHLPAVVLAIIVAIVAVGITLWIRR